MPESDENSPVKPDTTVVVRRSSRPRAPAEDVDATMNLEHARQRAHRVEEPPATELAPGYMLHEYRIESVLGRGGFGITYLATDVNLNSKVAIKEYLPRHAASRNRDGSVSPPFAAWRDRYEQGLESFLVEARTLATFRHPNIVRVARFFEANGTAYIVLEYERGRSLRNFWDPKRGMPERSLLTLFAPLLDGLAVVHEAGFLHRDIKPENICVRDDGSLVLLDFGSAMEATSRKGDDEADNDIVLYTPGFGPIEQYVNGEQGPWTDIYALGATFYWMITGDRPIEAFQRTGERDPLTPAATVGNGRYGTKLLAAIDWALKPQAKDRPKDVDELRKALFADHAAMSNLHDALAAGESKTFGRALMRPRSWPIAVKLTIAMVATALAPMLITAQYNFTASVERMSRAELGNLEQLAASLAGRVAQLIDDSRNLAEYLASDDDFVKYLAQPTPEETAALKAKLERLVKANADVQLAMVFDREGTAVVSSDPEVMGKNFKFREYFKSAMAGKPFMTGIVVGAVAGQPGVFFSNPVRNQEGAVIGAVVLRLKGQSVGAILSAARKGTRTPFLIDGDGVLIHHPDEAKLYQSLTPLSAPALEAIKADKRFRRDTIQSVDMPKLASAMVGAKSPGNVSYRSTISGKEEIAGFSPIKGQDWVVGVTETREHFEGPLKQLYANVLKSVAIVGAVFLLLAVLFARSIVRPIEALTRAAHALKGGDYDKANVKVTSGDEVGQLARVFNVMIDVLRQREHERSRRRDK